MAESRAEQRKEIKLCWICVCDRMLADAYADPIHFEINYCVAACLTQIQNCRFKVSIQFEVELLSSARKAGDIVTNDKVLRNKLERKICLSLV